MVVLKVIGVVVVGRVRVVVMVGVVSGVAAVGGSCGSGKWSSVVVVGVTGPSP